MRLLLLASFLSGAAALIYELLWMRELTLIAGSTQAAITSVLSVYFLGLALGNYLAGRVASRLARPMLVYLCMELLIGLSAVFFYVLLGAMTQFYTALYQSLPAGSPLIHALRIGSAAALLLFPTTCMGATIPLLVQFGTMDLPGASRWSARVYGLNTLGAMVGTFAAGFLLVEHFGVSGPLQATAMLNAACALCVIPWIRSTRDTRAQAADESAAGLQLSRLGVTLLLAFGLLGFANIAAEVLWTRFFALIFHNDTYVFSTILLIYLFGVGAGSIVGGRLLGRIRRPVFTLGVLQLTSAAWTVLMIYLVPDTVRLFPTSSTDYFSYMTKYLLCLAIGILVPTLCMGASFPLLVRAVTSHRLQVGSVVGRALSWNTIGGVFGAAFAGFLLLDRFGLQPGLLAIAALTAAVGLALTAATGEGRRRLWKPILALVVPAGALLVIQPPRLPYSLIELHFRPKSGMRIVDTSPSVHGTVTVTEESTGERRIWINNIWVAREGAHLAFGYVPWLLHPGPVETGLGICCGTGRTFGSLLNAGIPRLDLVEINRAVIDLSRKWFARSNHGVLTNPNVRVILDDGRNFVRYADAKYDLITLEPLQTSQKGVVYFYTKEFYCQARQRMNEGAVLCQWVPLYVPSPHEVKSICSTFIEVFPNSILWSNGEDAILLGYNTSGPRIDFDEPEVYSRIAVPAINKDLEQEFIANKYDVFVFTMMDGQALAAFAADGDVYTDDWPALEFTAPRTHGTVAENYEAIRPYLAPLDRIYDLPDPHIAALLTEYRDLVLDAHTASRPGQELRRRIQDVQRRLYGS